MVQSVHGIREARHRIDSDGNSTASLLTRKFAMRTYVGVLALLIPLLATYPCLGQGKARFGTIYPELKDCLEFSEDTGLWTTGKNVWKFAKGGKFVVANSSPTQEKNQFGRTTSRGIETQELTGTWKVIKRKGDHLLELSFETPKGLISSGNRPRKELVTFRLVEGKSRVDNLFFFVESSEGNWIPRLYPSGNGTPGNRAGFSTVEFRHASSAAGSVIENSTKTVVVADSIELPSALAASNWISQTAKYRASSQYERASPLESLLSDSDEMYATLNGVTAGQIIKNGFYAVHTNNEPGAHVQIDLGSSHLITGFYIKNRQESEAAVARAKDLTIWISSERTDKGVKVWASDKAEVEWYVVLPQPVLGQLITIGFPETKREYLHLTKVKVFGRD